MKTYLSFDDKSEDDRETLKNMLQANKMSIALWSVAMEVFRPARKHGYSDERLNELTQDEKVAEAIELLEHKFYEILREIDVSIDS